MLRTIGNALATGAAFAFVAIFVSCHPVEAQEVEPSLSSVAAIGIAIGERVGVDHGLTFDHLRIRIDPDGIGQTACGAVTYMGAMAVPFIVRGSGMAEGDFGAVSLDDLNVARGPEARVFIERRCREAGF